MNTLKDFTVDRRTWYRGRGPRESYLLKSDGRMCCVGFQCLAEGMGAEEILAHDTVRSLGNAAPAAMQTLDRAWEYDAIYEANDDKDMSDPEREDLLTELFARLGCKVTFEGE